MSKLEVIYRPLTEILTNPNNARKHSKAQIAKIVASIKSFGFNVPVLTDEKVQLIAGHGRIEAAKQLGLQSVPTIAINGLNEAQLGAFAIADNRIAELSSWDDTMLASEFEKLINLGAGLDFEIVDTGFEIGKIDHIISQAKEPETETREQLEPTGVPPVTVRGDLWQCGAHRLFCGDARDADSYRILLGAEKAAMTIADLPYNVPINGHVSGLGKNRHREFSFASGEMSAPEFEQFVETACEQIRAFSRDGALVYLFMDWRSIAMLIDVGSRVFDAYKGLC